MKKVALHKEVFLIENFLSKDESDYYLSLYKGEEFEEAKISVHGTQVMHKALRNNDRLLFFDEQLANHLWGRIKEFVPQKIGLCEAIGLNEMFRVYKYSKGQRFKMHQDGSFQRNEQESSLLSFLMYLNDDFAGGETEFRNIANVTPKKGMGLIFSHHIRHEGKEVLSGTKYVLRTDIMYRLSEL